MNMYSMGFLAKIVTLLPPRVSNIQLSDFCSYIVASFALPFLVLTLSGPTFAQTNSEDATRLLNKIVKAMGGSDALLRLDSFHTSTIGENYASHMGKLPDDVKMTGTYLNEHYVEINSRSIRTDATRQFTYEPRHGFPQQKYRIVTVDGVGAVSKGAHPLGLPGGDLTSQAVASIEKTNLLMNPHLLLRAVLKGARTAEYGGISDYRGKPHEILVISDEVAPIQLIVSQNSGHIAKLETMENHIVLRDSKLVVVYENWQAARSVWFPEKINITVAGNLLRRETRKSVKEQLELDGAFFALPKTSSSPRMDPHNYQFGMDTHHIHQEFFEIAGLFYAEGADYVTTQLAPNVFFVQDTSGKLLSGMAVSLSSGVVMLEGHTSPRAADQFADVVNELFPGKPITHLIQSHHHVDHSAGVRSIVARGAKLVVGHGVGNWWPKVLSADSEIRSDSLSKRSIQAEVKELSPGGTWSIADDDIRITVYHVGQNSHASDMVMTKIEVGDHRFLYQADLYNAGFGFTMAFDGPVFSSKH